MAFRDRISDRAVSHPWTRDARVDTKECPALAFGSVVPTINR